MFILKYWKIDNIKISAETAYNQRISLVAEFSAGLATIVTRKTSEIGGKNAQNF